MEKTEMYNQTHIDTTTADGEFFFISYDFSIISFLFFFAFFGFLFLYLFIFCQFSFVDENDDANVDIHIFLGSSISLCSVSLCAAYKMPN